MIWYTIALLYLWRIFKLWIDTLIIAPFRTPEMLWILVPVWLNWVFAEFFQEKLRTSTGNALSNSIVLIWGSVDCTRQTTVLIASGIIKGTWNVVARFSLAGLIFLYGLLIVFLGLRGSKKAGRVGRIREVTYVCMMFIPVFYNELPLTWDHFFAAAVYFPLFYFIVEVIDRITPNPKSIAEEAVDMGKMKF